MSLPLASQPSVVLSVVMKSRENDVILSYEDIRETVHCVQDLTLSCPLINSAGARILFVTQMTHTYMCKETLDGLGV